jgi:hypothetical protein
LDLQAIVFFKPKASQLNIMPLNFGDGTPFVWASQHRVVAGQSNYIVKNVARCRALSHIEHERTTHCSDEWYDTHLGVVARTDACTQFEIVQTATPIDFSPYDRDFRSKRSAFTYHFSRNIGKLFRKLNAAGG